MISRHEGLTTDQTGVWAQLAAPLPPGVIAWRQDGKPIARDGRYIARFVAYIEANTVRERLDAVVPGEWDLTLDLLPPIVGSGEDGDGTPCSFKARLQVLGVIREDVGTGRDYKQAATDAFKRAAVRFGIGHELYAYEQNWVAMDGDGRYAKPLEDPQLAYSRRAAGRGDTERVTTGGDAAPTPIGATAGEDEIPVCPKCGGRMWDNRLTKRNPRAPDFKCRDRACDGVIWPPRAQTPAVGSERDAAVHALPLPADEIPF